MASTVAESRPPESSTTAVVFIAVYLTFFPVTVAQARGLRSPDPRSLELMRSFAASKWDIYRKVRLPASLPYLFTALKVAAAAAIVGAIIGEGPGGVKDGLGRAIINFNQQYITGPEKLLDGAENEAVPPTHMVRDQDKGNVPGSPGPQPGHSGGPDTQLHSGPEGQAETLPGEA